MASQNKVISLYEVLSQIATQSANSWVYLSKDQSWSLNSRAAVLESGEVVPGFEDLPDAGIPEFAIQNGLQQVLPVTVVQDIIANARAQKPAATEEDFFNAFQYYFKNDAFLELE